MIFRAGSMSALLALLIALAAILVDPAVASEEASVETFLKEDGSGELWAQETEREGRRWTWEACDVQLTSCVAYAKDNPTTTARAAPETIFRATSAAGHSALSPVWHGKVESVEPPTVRGEVRANELVRPIPGRWSGGWDGDYNWMQLAACKRASGGDCITLTDQHYNGSCSHEAAVIDRAFTGYYLRVADRRVEEWAGISLYAISTPYAGELWKPGPLTRVAIVGRIKHASSPRTAKCGPPPIVARAFISKAGVARVKCTLGCRVTLRASRSGRHVKVGSRVRLFAKELKLPKRKLKYLGAGRARMVVLIDGERAARRTVRLP